MIPFIDSILEPFIWSLTDWSLRWAVLIGLLAAFLLIFRPRRASTRSLLCWVILLAGLLLPALPRWGPGFASPAPALQARSLEGGPMEGPRSLEVKDIVAKPAKSDETITPQARPPGGRAWQGPPLPKELEDTPEQRRSAEDSTSQSQDSEAWGTRRIILFGIGSLWIGGVLLIVIRWLGGLLFLQRLRRSALSVQGVPAQIFEACRQELWLGRKVILVTHPAVRSPITLGLLNPVILVPADWSSQPEATQRGALLHELAHLARYDDWSALLLELTRVLFFFHPLVYWLLARLERERELLCDEAAVSRGIDRQDYARMLLEFSRQAGRLRPTALISPSYPIRFGNRRTVKIRIHQLLEETMNLSKSPLSLRTAATVGVSVLVLALVLGSFRVRAIEPEAVPDMEEPVKPQLVAEETKKVTPEVFQIEPFHILKIRAVKTLPDEPISGNFLVEPEGKVDLGPSYGKVSVKGLTLEEAAAEVLQHLRRFLKDPQASVTLAGWTTKWKDDADKKEPFRIKPFHLLNIRAIGTPPDQPVSGPHLVEPGGKADLGPTYGKVAVKGLTLEEAAAEVLQHLRRFLKDPKVSVTLAGWENDWHDLEKDGAGPPTKAPAKSESKKEALRYDKKTFDEWRSSLLTELKPESRIEAIKALRAFGMNGYGEEATRAILEVLKVYLNQMMTANANAPFFDFDKDDSSVMQACSEALMKIGRPTVNLLIKDLKAGDKNDRLLALSALAGIGPQSESDIAVIVGMFKDQEPEIRIAAIRFFQRIQTDDKSAVAAVIEAMKDKNRRVRAAAIEAVSNSEIALERIKKMGPSVKALVSVLIQAINDKDSRSGVVGILGEIGPQAKSAVPALIQAFNDRTPLTDKELNRYGDEAAIIERERHEQIIKVLAKIQPDANSIVPFLIEAIKTQEPSVRKEVVLFLGKIGPEAKAAVPVLIKELKLDGDNRVDRSVVIQSMGSIGPGAKEAVPTLTELLNDPSGEVTKAAAKALEKIAK